MISFCIITNGRRYAVTRAAILSINHAARAAGVAIEIIVCGVGHVFARLPNVRVVDAYDAAATKRLGAMRNRAVKHIRGEIAVLLDDDCFVPENFIKLLLAFPQPWRILDTTVYDTHDSLMHTCGGHDQQPYLIGGFMAARRSIFDEILRDDSIVSHSGVEDEDQNYSRRLREGGYTIHFDPNDHIWHWNGDHGRKDHSPRFLQMLDKWNAETNRCFFVFGNESSGTRLWTEHLIACGLFGDATLEQRLDACGGHDWDTAGNLIVWRRSFPHADQFPDVGKMIERLAAAGYTDLACYWTQRDRAYSVKSMLKAGHAKTEEEAIRDIEEGSLLIGKAIRDHILPCRIVNYERLISEPDYRMKLLEAFDLVPAGELPALRDENAKWNNDARSALIS